MARSASYTLPFGALVGTTLSVYLRNLGQFTLLSAIVLLPWIVLRIILRQSTTSIGTEALSTILQAVLGMVLTGTLTYGVVQQLLDKRTDLGQLLSSGVSALGRVFVTGLVTGVIIGIGYAALLIPGLLANTLLFVAIPVAVMESKGVGAAMQRSAHLTEGSRWTVFGAVLLMLLVHGGVIVLAGFVFATTAGDFEHLPLWVEIVLPLLLNPISATFASVGYVLLRQGKENVDVQQISAVFD